MKKMIPCAVILLCGMLPLRLSGQQSCKVLLPALDSVYSGKCKNGLAHGQGEAWGKFYYKGRFEAGYPDGTGRAEYRDGSIYDGSWVKGLRQGTGELTWTQDGKLTTKNYVWAADTIKDEVQLPPYKILYQRNVYRYRVYRQGDGAIVWFTPTSQGGIATNDNEFLLTGSSGTEINYNPKFGYQDVKFPFKGSIRYKAWNKMRTTQQEILLELVINETGTWIVEVQN
jgi:hypothetical protein